jgi:hypothetical protein
MVSAMTKRPVSRRLMLKGVGVTLAVPFLEAMLHSGRSWAAPSPRARFAVLYMGNGMLTGRGGSQNDFWSCAGSPAGITTLSTPMQELAAFTSYMTVVQNCSFGLIGMSGDAGHEQAAPSFLTGQNIANDANVTPPIANSGNVTRLAQPGSSLDRLLAKNSTSRLQQLMMAVGPGNGGFVNTDPHNQMMANLSWDSQTTHFNNETLRSAQQVFSQLTSSGLPSSASVAMDAGAGDAGPSGPNRKKSVLDAVLADLNGLNARLGASDRLVMNQYADSIRTIETNLQAGAVGLGGACAAPTVGQQAQYQSNSPVTYATVTSTAQNMIDLMALAFQCGFTNVSTLMLSYDWSRIPTGQFSAAYAVPNITGTDSYHNASHYNSAGGEALGAVQGINTWHAKQLAYLARVFKNTPDSDGRTLLDNSVVLFGAAMGDPDMHSYQRMLRVILGRGLTLNPGTQGKLIDANGAADAHPRLLQTIANAFGVNATVGMSGNGTISGIF